jgi:CBS domain-containing protein
MIEHNIKRLPVVSADRKLLGIVSRVDVLRALSQAPLAALPHKPISAGHYAQVGEIMTTNVPTVHAGASLAEVVGQLVGSVQRRVVVLDEADHVVGIVTDGDLISRATSTERSGIIRSLSRRLIPGGDESLGLSNRTVADVMTTPVITVTPQLALSEALQLLLTNHIKRLPVIDDGGKLVGLVGRGGILQALAQNDAASQPPE